VGGDVLNYQCSSLLSRLAPPTGTSLSGGLFARPPCIVPLAVCRLMNNDEGVKVNSTVA
jgi:hypothetical protein